MRPLFVSHAAQTAGAEQALAFFAGELKRLGHDPVAAIPDEGPLARSLDAQGVPWFVAPYPWRLPREDESADAFLDDRLERARDLAEYFRAAAADLVVVNTAVIPEAVMAATLAGLPVVLHAHGLVSRALVPELNIAAWRAAEDAAVSFADHIAAPSAWTADFFAFAHGVAPDRLTVIPNVVSGLETLEPTPPGEAIVQLGTVEPNKNQAMLLRAVARVKQGGVPVSARILGDAIPDYRQRLQRRIALSGLADSVTIEKRTGDPDAAYRRAGIVVVTSRLESFSRVCLEGMAHGRAVVATRCGGPEGLIEDGRTGFLVDVDDHLALADRLRQLIASPELRQRLGAAAREEALTRFSPAAVTPAYVALLQRVAETGGPRAPDWSARQARAFALSVAERGHEAAAEREPSSPRRSVARRAAELVPTAPQGPVAADRLAARLVDERRVRERPRPGPVGKLQTWRRRGVDLTDDIQRSWFAPWLTAGKPGDRIALSEFVTAGQALSYVIHPEEEELSGLDIAPWLYLPADRPVLVLRAELHTLDGSRRLTEATAEADETTGQDSLRLRFEAVETREPLLLRLTGLPGADLLGLKLYERRGVQRFTRRLFRRELLCGLIYGRR